MANGVDHRIGAALVAGAVAYNHEKANGQQTTQPVMAAGLAAMLGTLPDIIEPASHPNHRQFFHSVSMLGLIGYGAHKLYTWQPKDRFENALRFMSLVACGAYVTHLLMDSATPKSLPLI